MRRRFDHWLSGLLFVMFAVAGEVAAEDSLPVIPVEGQPLVTATEPAEKAVKPEKPKKADAPTPVTEAVGADEPADEPAAVAEAPDVTEIDAADATADEPADAPDSITEPAAEREPVTGDDTDNSGEPTGDESA